MNRLSIILSITILTFTIISCSNTPSELDLAQDLMESSPDSALYILKRKNINSYLRPRDKALYALLYHQAMDKNDIEIESDSIINIATDFFDKKEPIYAGYSWFYKSRCDKYRDDTKAQVASLIKAEEFVKNSTEFKLNALISSDKASMYKGQLAYDSAIIYFKNANFFFNKLNDTINATLSLINIGYTFQFTNQLDSSNKYYSQAERTIKNYNNPVLHSIVQRSLGAIYFQEHKYSQSIYHLQNTPITGFDIYDNNKWYLLACVYVKTNQLDTARLYLNKITSIDEIAPDYYKQWQLIYESEGNTSKALHFAKLSLIATDSLYKHKLNISFAGLEKKYKYQSLQVFNQELMIQNKQHKISFLVVLIVLSLGIIIVLYWRFRTNINLFKKQQLLLEQERKIVLKEKENNQLLETQIKMNKILLLNVEQYRLNSFKRSTHIQNISPINNINFYQELIACMDIEHNDISQRLINRFPDLTERDILICCLLLAKFDSGMIASILEVKIESINKHRYRLRAKLGLNNTESLVEYLKLFM